MRIEMLTAKRKEGRLSLPYLAFLVFESAVKGMMFDCRMCGQCILSYTGFACPMRCPKQLRNGPCGGTRPGGYCEVYEDMECAWYRIYKRSQALHMEDKLEQLQPAIDWRLQGTASWLNHLSGADKHIKPMTPAKGIKLGRLLKRN
jgi:hypothetical protein